MTLLRDLIAEPAAQSASAKLLGLLWLWGQGWVCSLGVLIGCSCAVQWDKEDITVPIPHLVVFLLAGEMF